MKVVIGIPTGQRPKATLCFDEWEKRGTELVIGTWDRSLQSRYDLAIYTKKRMSFAWYQNLLAAQSDWDLFICGADDLYPGTFSVPYLDVGVVREWDGIIWIHDGFEGRQPTHPIITRGW